MEKKPEFELTPFQIRNIELLTHLYELGAVTDQVTETLRHSELDYFSLLEKYKILEKKIDIDEKLNILKYKKDYLTNIIKTASRVYHDLDDSFYHVSLVRLDIDDFSIFNNKYGHELGDKVLIQVAQILKDNSRPTDYVIRFGGEEFDIILPSTNLEGGKIYLDNILSKIRESTIIYEGEELSVLASAGLSSYEYSFSNSMRIEDSKIEEIYKKLQNEADDALYEAKYLGKNQFCVYSEEMKDKYQEIRNAYSQK